jgi:hypothetical protein
MVDIGAWLDIRIVPPSAYQDDTILKPPRIE